MCGIVGLYQRNQLISTEALQKAAKTMDHRGPDDCGTWFDGPIGLAHARLSIHDLTQAGHQPMLSHSGRWVIAFNGEIYNYRSLRQILAPAVTFSSDSDTEVLLAAIETWGVVEALKKTVGMFAFACWDREEKKLYLARDRFGEKPLYYGWQNNSFMFASELKALKGLPGWQGEINRDALCSYLRHCYVPTPLSIYEGINKLEPGYVLTLDQKGQLEQQCYWSAIDTALSGYQNPLPLSFDGAVDQLDTLLRQTLSEQMVADVPVGAFLSGGIDSSAIVALMQSLSSQPIRTFSIGFNEKRYNEAPFAKAVAKHLKTEHTELYVDAKQALDVIPNLASIYDEPFADSSQVPTFLVSQLTKQHVTVSLSGDAGDEIFGGYNRYLFAESVRHRLVENRLASMAFKLVPERCLGLLDYVPQKRVALLSNKLRKLQQLLSVSKGSFIEFYRNLCSQTMQPESLVLQGESFNRILEKGLPAKFEQMDAISWMMLSDSVTYLLDDILTKVDRAAMAVSLETRVPFLDHRVFEFAWKLPLQYKVKQQKGKCVLREMLYRYVPKSLIERPKMGFGIPYGEWLRQDLRPWAESLLAPEKLESQGYLNTKSVTRLWSEHVSGKRDWQAILWNILMFQAWLEHWKS